MVRSCWWGILPTARRIRRRIFNLCAASDQAVLRIHHVKIRVRNLEESVAFYRQLFDFDVQGDIGSPTRECMLRDEKGEAFGIVLSQSTQQSPTAQTLDHICFEVPSYEDVVRVYEKASVIGKGATAPRYYEKHWQTFVFDPDGHKIEVLTTAGKPTGSHSSQEKRAAGVGPVS